MLLSFHQPSPAMYELLDRVFLMSKGHVVFCGEPGAAYEHFEHAGVLSPPFSVMSSLSTAIPTSVAAAPWQNCYHMGSCKICVCESRDSLGMGRKASRWVLISRLWAASVEIWSMCRAALPQPHSHCRAHAGGSVGPSHVPLPAEPCGAQGAVLRHGQGRVLGRREQQLGQQAGQRTGVEQLKQLGGELLSLTTCSLHEICRSSANSATWRQCRGASDQAQQGGNSAHPG